MNNDGVSLRGYLTVLARRWRLVAGTVLLFLLVAAAYVVVQPPVYSGTAQVQIEPVTESEGQPQPDGGLSAEELHTQERIATSQSVTEDVIRELDLDEGIEEVSARVSAELVADTVVLSISARGSGPDEAARLADTYATSYLRFRQDQLAAEVSRSTQQLRQREAHLRERLTELDGQIAAASEPEAGPLTVQRQSLENLLRQVAEDTARSASTRFDGVGGAVIDEARGAENRVAPKPVRDGGLAAVLGLLVGGGLAFVRDHGDDTIRDEEGLRSLLGSRAVVGAVGHRRHRRLRRGRRSHDAVASMVEAYQPISAGVRGMLAELPCGSLSGRCLLVSGTSRDQGASMGAVNLAVASARTGLRVLLIDADLRQPTLSDRLGLSQRSGLAEVLAGGVPAADHTVDVGIENLRVLPAGSVPANPAELLTGPACAAVLTELVGLADLVVLDGGPTDLGDTVELAARADLAVLVVAAGRVAGREVTAAAHRLERVGGRVVAVCNGSGE